MNKQRIDILLAEKNLCESRARAKSLIMMGKILVNGQKIDKAGTLVAADSEIKILGEEMPFVSRGGFKLQKAVEVFNLNLEGKIAADIGASTGGFTDCMLQRGAKKVYAIDVGYGQLAWKLRNDDRVVNLERTNIRNVETLPDILDFASIDVAFISLDKVLPVAFKLLSEVGEIAALIKPQFEAGKENVGKKGVVKDKKIHSAVIEYVLTFAQNLNFKICGLDFSPIKGPEGNIEYLAYLSKNPVAQEINFAEKINSTVDAAHDILNSK
ncbi:MAG: TlyA family RNA methyltransferase [Selenomonadaceae bacterium]|nr:TlyA family RNA methyltransferase [Selenomonadaceae bacterium]